MQLAPSGDPIPLIVTWPIAATLGISASRVRTEVRNSRWQRLADGLFLTRSELPTRQHWIVAGIVAAGTGAALTGWDGLRTYGIGSDRPPLDDVLIVCSDGRHRRVGRVWIRPSERDLRATSRTIDEGRGWRAPTVSCARAVADAALIYRTFRPVRALVTQAVQAGLCDYDELQIELEAGPRNGSAHLRRALEDVSIGAGSIAEAEAIDILVAANLPKFEVNVPIVVDGQVRYIVDLLWRELRCGLEIDSRQHHQRADKWKRTLERHNVLSALGIPLTHYAPETFTDSADVCVAQIDQWLRRRALELGVDYVPAPGQRPPSHSVVRPLILP